MPELSEFDPTKSMSAVAAARWRWRDQMRHFADLHDAIHRDLLFGQDMEHYLADNRVTLDLRRIKPKGEELMRRGRYIHGAIMNQPLYFEGLPTEHHHSMDQVEQARDVVEFEFTNPLKRFEDVLSRAVWAAVFGRMSFLKQSFDPLLGSHGEIIDECLRGDAVTWTPGYADFHHPACPRLTEKMWIPLEIARAMKGWDSKDLVPDDGRNIPLYQTDNSLPGGQVQLEGTKYGIRMGQTKQPRVSICLEWTKRDYTKKMIAPPDAPNLPEGEEYMACPECGYQSAPQREQDSQMPDWEPGGCPDCHADIYRVTQESAQSTLAYPRGEKLLIFAPFSPGYEDRPVYEGPWPYTRDGYTLRSFPYAKINFGEHSENPCGQSETSLFKSTQQILNAIKRHGYEQSAIARLMLILPRMGLQTYNKEPYVASDQNGPVAFSDSDYVKGSVEWIQPPVIGNGLIQFHDMMTQAGRSNEGTSEVGADPETMKGTPVGTINAWLKTGNVPIDDKVRMLRRALSMYACVRLDLWRATAIERRPVRLSNPRGANVQELSGFDLVSADIILTATPNVDAMSQERRDAWQALVSAPKQYRQSMARALNLPPSIIREIERDEQQAGPPQTPPEQIVAALQAIAQLLRSAPGSVAENQIQALLQMVGAPPPQGASVLQSTNRQTPPPPSPTPGQANGGPQIPAALMQRMASLAGSGQQ